MLSTFKGILPNQLFDRYDDELGYQRMEFDLHIAAEIGERIKEQTEESKGSSNAKSAVARRNQKRHQQQEKISSEQMGGIINDWVTEE